jgi:hypothetical protein
VLDPNRSRRVKVLVKIDAVELHTTAELTRHADGTADLTDFHLAKSGEPVTAPFPQLCDFLIQRDIIIMGKITVRHAGEERVLHRLSREQRRRLRKGRR